MNRKTKKTIPCKLAKLNSRLLLPLSAASSAVASFAHQSVALNSLDSQYAVAFASYWSLLFFLLGGFFSSIELEIARLKLSATDIYRGFKGVILPSTIACLVISSLLIASRDRIPRSDVSLFLIMNVVAILGYLIQVCLRGYLAGHNMHNRFMLVIQTDAYSRLVVLLICSLIGLPPSLVIALPIVASSISTIPLTIFLIVRGRRLKVSTSEFFYVGMQRLSFRNVSSLTISNLTFGFFISGTPFAISYLTDVPSSLISPLFFVLLVARSPLLFATGLEGFAVRHLNERYPPHSVELSHLVKRVIRVTILVAIVMLFLAYALRLERSARELLKLEQNVFPIMFLTGLILLLSVFLNIVLISANHHSELAFIWSFCSFLLAGLLLMFSKSQFSIASVLLFSASLAVSLLLLVVLTRDNPRTDQTQ